MGAPEGMSHPADLQPQASSGPSPGIMHGPDGSAQGEGLDFPQGANRQHHSCRTQQDQAGNNLGRTRRTMPPEAIAYDSIIEIQSEGAKCGLSACVTMHA